MPGLRRWPSVLVGAVMLCCSVSSAGISAAAAGVSPGSVVQAASGSVWIPAEQVPGTAMLNAGNAVTTSVSCTSAGNCGAGGYYTDNSSGLQPFVVDEVDGTWGDAQPVPGMTDLNTGHDGAINVVSCASPGNCSAGGEYYDGSGDEQAFVVGEVNGTWASAEEVPGVAPLNADGGAQVTAISCTSPGYCSAGGVYSDSRFFQQLFVVDEVNGTWGNAEEVPGMAALNVGVLAEIVSVSCVSAGNCSGGGYYEDGDLRHQPFVVDEVNGIWADAEEVPGMSSLNGAIGGEIASVSCSSAGNCSAGGGYGNSGWFAFVVSEVDGTWGNAQEVPGFAALNIHSNGQVNSLSCTSPGNCSAGGYYYDGSDYGQSFVVDEVNGTWGNGAEVVGASSREQTLPAAINTVSCASPGNCSAGGYYTDFGHQAFVVDEINGTWGSAVEVPGTSALNTGGNSGAEISSMSCPSVGRCSAGGFYSDRSGDQQAFVVSQKMASATTLSLSASSMAYENEQNLQASVTVSASGVPTGTVAVKAGSATLCTITLAGGAGSCSPSATALPIGSYKVTASYKGDADDSASVSPAQALTVSQPASCPVAFVVGVHGMGEGPSKTISRVSPTIADTFGALKTAAKALHKQGENTDPYVYDTISVSNFSTLAKINHLVGKVNKTAGQLEADLETFSRACPSTPVSLVGYSMGAWIINDLLSSYRTEWKRLKAVVLYGDPCWYDSSKNYKGLVRYASDLGCMPMSSYPYPAASAKTSFKVRSLCISKDPICGNGFAHINDQLKAVKACIKGGCPHYGYVQGYPKSGDAVTGGTFLAKNAWAAS